MDHIDFRDLVYSLVGQDVEVITVHGTFRGTPLSVGSNFLKNAKKIGKVLTYSNEEELMENKR
ncbi:hypothetical protein [Bacillus sp. EB600]|uniref:hypothetical protein n=1 Tax=Bacillus sp. EB600 TaxID=2806345 RepID=UPI00210E9954|nr:hypothetical protein [Bacillus sp. EB600]MCQ6281961.1 hypothetical protein [Bacillus sp. EB600]